MINGIEGLLAENLKVLNDIFKEEENLKLLENTPAAALGSCRLKLPDSSEDKNTYEKIFRILSEKNIKYFFYIGGNDSMDTVKKLSSYVRQTGLDVKIIGVPKTIDNDLSGTDHSPGYGSAAKYIAASIRELSLDNAVYTPKSVLIAEIMGRDAGWLTAAAALPRLTGGNGGADLVYLPEVEFDSDRFIADIEKRFEKRTNVVIAVSEGIKYGDGTYVCETNEKRETDIFGNTWLTGSANVLKRLVRERLKCKVRAVELNTQQRCAGHMASLCDISEAVEIGKRAVETAVSGKSGVMMTFTRISTEPYKAEIDYKDITGIANKARKVPLEYITPEKNNVTDECLEYILPLILGEPDITYKNGLPFYFRLF
jgi:6-phosphofructokinase 1